MTVTSYPGVYMEEIPGGARPIEAAGTSTAAFFGVADQGPIGQVRKIFGFGEFEKFYGGFRTDGQFLAHSVYQFFNNGGRSCYIGRVSTNYKTASVTIFDRTATDADKSPSLTVSASSPGAWGNSLLAEIASDPANPNVFTLTVKNEVPDRDTGGKKIVALEQFENLSMDPDSSGYVETVVGRDAHYISVTDETKANKEARAGKGYSESGIIEGADGGADFIAATQRKFRLNINSDGWRTVDISGDMQGKDPKSLADIATAFGDAIKALGPLRSTTPTTAYSNVTAEVRTADAGPSLRRQLRITSGAAGVASRVEVLPFETTQENLTGALKLGSRNGGIEVFGHSALRPMDSAPHDSYFIGDDTEDTAAPRRVSHVVAGDDGSLPQPTDYADAFAWLDKITDVSLIAVPGVGSSFLADRGMGYCRNRQLSDCFYIADMPSYYDTLQEAKDYVQQINTPNSYGAVYFPWLKMPDPTGQSPLPLVVPSSGFVAGMYAQIDARRGVWKAPAGLEAALSGAVGLTAELSDQEHGDLNKQPKSVCVIRKFAASGMVLWGARTLSTDPEYSYIPVRRVAIMLRKSIYDGIQWAVFEGNDERLWSALRLNIGSFMNGLFRAGAFQGSKASDAYFVRCGLGDTMTQDDIDRGQVIVLVGFAPLKPAEFVIVRIQQKVGQAA